MDAYNAPDIPAESQKLAARARRSTIAAVVILFIFLAFRCAEDAIWAHMDFDHDLRFAINAGIIVVVFGGILLLMKKAGNWEARAKLIRCGMEPEEARLSLRGLRRKMADELVRQAVHDYALLHPTEVEARRAEIKKELLEKYRVSDERAGTVLADGPALLKQKLDGLPVAAAPAIAYAALRRRDGTMKE